MKGSKWLVASGGRGGASLRNAGALLAVPMLLLTARWLNGGPEPARAMATVEAAAPMALARPSVPAGQADVLASIESIDMAGPIASPLAETFVEPAEVVTDDEPRRVQTLPGGPSVRLTGVMATRQGGIATINGRVLRIGELVAPGWTLSRVDAKDAAVEITRFDGTVQRIEQPR